MLVTALEHTQRLDHFFKRIDLKNDRASDPIRPSDAVPATLGPHSREW